VGALRAAHAPFRAGQRRRAEGLLKLVKGYFEKNFAPILACSLGVEGGSKARRMGGRPPIVLSLTAEEEVEPRSRLRAHTGSKRDVSRARIVLVCTEARGAEAVAKDLGVDVKTVEVWRRRFDSGSTG